MLWAGQASADPGAESARHVGLANASRASSTGTSAAFVNPANLGITQQFAVDAMYQLALGDNTHGIAASVADSLNNARVGLALYYKFAKGTPRIGFTDDGGTAQNFDLSLFGHEAGGALSIAAVKGWWWLGIAPRFAYLSTRYLDDDGVVHDARPKFRTFGMDVSTTFSILGWANLSVIGRNLVGNSDPAWTEDDPITLENVADVTGDHDYTRVDRLSEYPLTVVHALSIQPLRRPSFSLNFDGEYDFTSYANQEKYLRKLYAGGIEFTIREMIPLRGGAYWDSRGRGSEDDRVYVGFGLGFVKTPKRGGMGVDVSVSGRQQVVSRDGAPLETVIGVNLGLRLHPDL
jgi:hypothetical protein